MISMLNKVEKDISNKIDFHHLHLRLNKNNVTFTLKQLKCSPCVNKHNGFKAKNYAISSDTHQLESIKLHHFKQERF